VYQKLKLLTQNIVIPIGIKFDFYCLYDILTSMQLSTVVTTNQKSNYQITMIMKEVLFF